MRLFFARTPHVHPPLSVISRHWLLSIQSMHKEPFFPSSAISRKSFVFEVQHHKMFPYIYGTLHERLGRVIAPDGLLSAALSTLGNWTQWRDIELPINDDFHRVTETWKYPGVCADSSVRKNILNCQLKIFRYNGKYQWGRIFFPETSIRYYLFDLDGVVSWQ